MPDNPASDQPAGDSFSDVDAEVDIDALLAGAGELAAGLEAEVGASEADASEPKLSASPVANVESSPPDERATPAVDAQLDEIDSLLDRACEELGPAEPSGPAENDPPASDPPQDDPAPPEPERKAEGPEQAAAATPAQKANSIDMEMPDLSDLEGLPDFDALPDLDPSPQSESDAPGTSSAATAVPPDGTVSSARLWRALNRVADLLVALDKPLGWLGGKSRLLIGWAALAILFAAACITAISLLG